MLPGVLIVTVIVPGILMVPVNSTVLDVTVNGLLLVAVPTGVVTLMLPVVADAGTVTTNCVVVAVLTEVVTPLNLTVLALGVALKPVP
jgi:hypothetical protein